MVEKLKPDVGTRNIGDTRDTRWEGGVQYQSRSESGCNAWEDVSYSTADYPAVADARYRLLEVSLEGKVAPTPGYGARLEWRIKVTDDGINFSYYQGGDFYTGSFEKHPLTLSPPWVSGKGKYMTVIFQVRLCSDLGNAVEGYCQRPTVEKRTSDSYRVDLT